MKRLGDVAVQVSKANPPLLMRRVKLTPLIDVVTKLDKLINSFDILPFNEERSAMPRRTENFGIVGLFLAFSFKFRGI